jgi:hypothetical protein
MGSLRNFLIISIFLFAVLLVSPTDASAADRYWVGGSANWDATAGTKWALTSGGAGGQAVPTASDNCFFDAASGAVTVTLNTAARTCLNADFTGFTGTFAGTQTWTISGGLTLGAGMTITYTGAITFNATSGTNVITSNGKALLSSIAFNGTGGTWQLADTFTSSLNLTLTAGTFDANGQTVVLNGSGQTLTGTFTFANLTRTGTASISTLSLVDDLIVTGTLTLNGNSATSRLVIQPSLRGTSHTITAGALVVSNLDIEGMNAAGAANWDLSAITGLSGDAGGNSGITFTPAQTNYWVGDTGNWSDVSHWASTSGGAGGTGRVSLVQDIARFDENSFSTTGQIVTYDVSRMGSIDWTGVVNAPQWTVGSGSTYTLFGSLTHSAGMSIVDPVGNKNIDLRGYGSRTLTNGGVVWPIVDYTTNSYTVRVLPPPGSTYTLMDDFDGVMRVSSGTFDANGHNLTIRPAANFGFVSTGSVSRTINMGSGLWDFIWPAAGTVWNNNPDNGGLTVNGGTSTIKVTGPGPLSLQANSGSTYYNFWNATVGQISRFTTVGGTGNTTWNNIKIDPGNTHQFIAGTTTTVSSMTITGTLGNVITIGSTTGATHNLVKTGGGVISGDYLSISNSVVSPADTWYAGANSFDGGGNSGWIFAAAPVVEVESSTSSGSRPRAKSVAQVTTPTTPTTNTTTPTTPNPVNNNSGCVIISNILKLGFRGAGVTCLQQKLNSLLTLNLSTDGIFGPATRQAVIDFQTKNNLVPDGIVGPLTKAKLQ